MKYFLLVLPAVVLGSQAPSEWETCQIGLFAHTVQSWFDVSRNVDGWPNCPVKILQTPMSVTVYITKETRKFAWEIHGTHEYIEDGFYKYLPELQLEISLKGTLLTLKGGEGLFEGAYGECMIEDDWKDPQCVETWGHGKSSGVKN